MQNYTLMSVYAVTTLNSHFSHFSQKIHNSPPSLESSLMLKLPITLFPMLQHRCSYNASALESVGGSGGTAARVISLQSLLILFLCHYNLKIICIYSCHSLT